MLSRLPFVYLQSAVLRRSPLDTLFFRRISEQSAEPDGEAERWKMMSSQNGPPTDFERWHRRRCDDFVLPSLLLLGVNRLRSRPTLQFPLWNSFGLSVPAPSPY